MMKRIQNECEVLVIGGGPGGAMACSNLVQNGIEAVLFEKEKTPLLKVGENVIPHFWKFAELMKVKEKVEKEGFVFKAGGSSCWNGKFRKMKFSDFNYSTLGMHVERDKFDKLLLDHVETQGAKIFYEVKALKVINDKGGVEVEYHDLANDEKGTIKCKYLIDASGQSSLVGLQENLRQYDEAFRFNAYWGYYKGGYYLDANANFVEFGNQLKIKPMTIQSNVGEWGWVWHIIQREFTSLGIIVPKSKRGEYQSFGDNNVKRFESAIRKAPIIKELLTGSELIVDMGIKSIIDYSYQPKKFIVGNCYMVGDAAAFVDPINSAGILMALFSAYSATWAIIRSFKFPNRAEEYKTYYETQMQDRVEFFKLLAYPSEYITDEMIERNRNIVRQMGSSENQLAFTQCTLTNRSKNLNELIGDHIPPILEDLSLEEVLRAAPQR